MKIVKFEFKVTIHLGLYGQNAPNSLWTKCTQLWPLNTYIGNSVKYRMSAVIYFFLMAQLEHIIVNIIGRYIAKHEENQLRRHFMMRIPEEVLY